MKMLKIVLLAVFTIATPLLMFRQAVIISDRQDTIDELRIQHIHDSANWALQHIIDSMALDTARARRYIPAPAPARITIDYSKLPLPPNNGDQQPDTTLINQIYRLDQKIASFISAQDDRWKSHESSLVKSLDNLQQQISDLRNMASGDTAIVSLSMGHADDLLHAINKLKSRQKERLGITDNEITFLRQLLKNLRKK